MSDADVFGAAPAPVEMSDEDVFGAPAKPSTLSRVASGVGNYLEGNLNKIGHYGVDTAVNAYKGADQAYQELKKDVTTAPDFSTDNSLVGDVLQPAAPISRAMKIAGDAFNVPIQAAVGAVAPYAAEPVGRTMNTLDPRYSSEEYAKLTPEQQKETGTEVLSNVANIPFAADGAGVLGHAEDFARAKLGAKPVEAPPPPAPTQADTVLNNISQGKPADAPPTPEPAAPEAPPGQQAAAPAPAPPPSAEAPQAAPETKPGPHAPAFDIQTGNYGVRGPGGDYSAPPTFLRPEDAEAEASRLNATDSAPQAAPEEATQSAAAPEPAQPLAAAPNLTRMIDVDNQQRTVNLPDENHAALLDYAQGLERAQEGSAEENLKPTDIYGRFKPWVHDEFSNEGDVNNLAEDYLHELRNTQPDATGALQGHVVVDPSVEADYVRRYGQTPAMTAAADNSGYTMLDPREIQRDPDRFQYKAADENGVTGALNGVKKWEPDLASPITAWRDEDGNLFVVNGHQRTDLAARAQAAGQADVRVPARIFNAADGYTPEYMRALGAAQNIAEGSGTAIDAAKIMRSASAMPEDMRLPELPPRSQLVKDAQGLTKLSDEAFGMVTNEIVPPEYAAEVGRRIADPTEQMAALDALSKANPANAAQAHFMVDDIVNSGFLKGDQTSLFGNEQMAQSLLGERSRILDNAQRTLRRNRTVFNAAVTGEDTFAGAGNVLDRESNMKGKTDNEQLIAQLAGATRKGELSDALTASARDLASGKPVASVTSRFLARARQVIEDERRAGPVEARADTGGDGYARPTEADGQSGLGFGEDKGYGGKNALVSAEDADAARQVLRRATDGTQMNSGLDPEVIAAGIKLAAYHIEAGARAFADFSTKMIADMGEAVRPYLRDWYDGAQRELAARTEKTGQGDQYVMPGAERSAIQATASRGDKITAKSAQKGADEGLFAPKEKAQGDMFGTPLPKGFSEEAATEAKGMFDKAASLMEGGKGPLKYPVNLARAIGKVANDSMLGRTVRRIVSPGTFDDTARLAARGIRQVFGQMYVRDLQTAHALKGAVETLDKMTPEEHTQFAIAMDEGKKQPTPELQAIADNVTAQTKAATARLQSLGILDDAKENYLGRIWKPRGTTVDASTANKVLARLTAKRPLTGGKSFMKQRFYDTYREAIESGLEPVFENPITTQLAKLSEMNRFYAGTLVARAAKQSGFAKFFRMGEDHGDMMELEGPEFHRATRTIDHGDGTSTSVPEGAWFAPEGYARVYNNFVSKGLEGTALAEPAKYLRNASNLMNSLQLGLSFFHPVFTSIDGQMSRVGIAIDQAVRGQYGKAASNMQGMIPFNWRGNFVEGDNLLKAILDPKDAPPEMQRIVDAFGSGGGRAFMQRVLRPTDEGAIKIWKSGAFGRAIQDAAKKYPDSPFRKWMNVTGRALETTAAPVMDYIVPRQKLGVFSKLASDWIQSHPDATNTEFVAAMQDRWESVDNRLGQMVYDNLFWNKTMKDIAFITTRSVGWNMGSIREIGGGAADFGKFALDKFGGREAEWTHRMSYLIALPLVTGVYGAMLQYAFTGQGPQEMKDYFYPKTGLKRTDGSADRVSVPSYMKDVFAYANNPGQTLMNKANPFLSFLDELASGKDYYGDLIANKDDPYYKQVGDVLGFAAKNFMPFSIQGTKRLFQERPGPSAALGMFGVTPAPGYITNPHAQEKWNAREHKQLVTKTRKHELKENNVQPLRPMNP